MRCCMRLERAQHLRQRRHLHVRALGAVIRGVERLVRILAPQTVQDSDLGRDDELAVSPTPPGRRIIPSVDRICTPSDGSLPPTSPRPRSSRSRTRDGSGTRRPGCSRALPGEVRGVDAGVHVALAHPDVDVLPARHAPHVRAEEHVGEEEDLLVGGDRVHDLDRVARRAAVVALRLHLGGRVDVRDDDRARDARPSTRAAGRRRSWRRANSRRRGPAAARSSAARGSRPSRP